MSTERLDDHRNGVAAHAGGPYVGSLSRVLWRWVRDEVEREILAAGFTDLSPAHIGVFRNPTPDGARPTELAAEMGITKQSLNELLGQLEHLGYLRRERDPDDQRGRRIRLTERGHDVLAVSWRAAARAERTIADLLGAERFRAFRAALVDAVEAIGARTTAGLPTSRQRS